MSAKTFAEQWAEMEAREAASAAARPDVMELAWRVAFMVVPWNSIGDPLVGDDADPRSWLELVIHEVCHAVTVGYDGLVTKDYSSAVSAAIQVRIQEEMDYEEVNSEEDALGLEWWVWQELDFPYEVGVLFDLGHVQGVEQSQVEEGIRKADRSLVPVVLERIRASLAA